MVSIDGVEYVPVTGRRVTVDGVVFAELVLQSHSTPAITRLVDGDGDEWHATSNPDRWDYKGRGNMFHSRSYILKTYGIDREY